MSKRTFTIKDFFGEDIEVEAKFGLYEVTDFMGKPLTIPAILLDMKTEEGYEPFGVLTKSFGEFIGIKNTAYMDLNNCPYATFLLTEGLAIDTGLTKSSGFCVYPLWAFKEEFLQEIGGEEYKEYSEQFDNYMYEVYGQEPEDDEDFDHIM